MVTLPKLFKPDEMPPRQTVLPLLPLRDIVVFPHMVAPLFVGRAKSVNALTEAMGLDKQIFLATQKKAGVDNPKSKDINKVGTIGTILQLLRLSDGTVKALVEGRQRAEIGRFIAGEEGEDAFRVELSPLEEAGEYGPQVVALTRAVLQAFEGYSKLDKSISNELIGNMSTISDPSKLADSIASHFSFKIQDKQKLLETVNVADRLSLLVQLIKMEMEIFQMDKRIKGRVKDQMEKTQKQYYLNEQIRAIKKEMGSEEDPTEELNELEKRIRRKRMSKEAGSKVRQEFKKLKQMTPMSAEATVVRNYIDWLISLPWFNKSKVRKDIEAAEEILNEDHYGLERPKERILEYLAVQSLVKKLRGPILCLVGPPGVGKTSLAKSVARSTGRKFVRLSLGGVRDEAEIRGHRRTYIGAMPGKIVQSLKKAGVNNPVFCLDEIDKMSMDFRGDPSAALLEVLDPEQNDSFNDHYLDVDYDLSDILFITTANTLPDIPLPLQDRMEVIRLPGYTEHEKCQIAQKFLIPKQIEANGLAGKDVRFSRGAVMNVIRHYTREAGVRNLEREIASICRKVARAVMKDKEEKVYLISETSISKYLGPQRHKYGQIEETDQVGMVTGLAWTQVGGELLCVEALIMPGKGELTVTGKLGDVMKESAQAAMSYVRSRAESLMLDKDFYKSVDIHVHIPEGAIPKDGPSAGISMCTAIASALTRRPVRRDIAMTGEITLRGRVLPIGGLKEKVLAAHRGNIRQVLIPSENQKDTKDIPASITKKIALTPVEHMDEVLAHALVTPEGEPTFKRCDIPLEIASRETPNKASLI
jgi:ATP-dependent Lon protease